jgi:hypothetical protein
MTRTYVCPTHETTQSDWCGACLEDFKTRRHRDDMTGEERAAEIERWTIVTIPIRDIHQRIEELVGRSVFTHEMGGDANFARLQQEARTNDHPSFREILGKVPDGVPVVIVDERG